MPSPDVAIVGAGVIGAAVAYELARSTTLRIVVFDRGTPGCEASNAAAGVLAVASSRARQGALLALRHLGAGLFPELVAALEDETEIRLGYRHDGLLALAFSDAEATALRELVSHRITQGYRCEMLDRAAVLSVEPALSPRVHAGALFHDDASIDNERLVAAFVTAARQRGVQFRLRTAVRAVESVGGSPALQLDTACVPVGSVIVAAGAWSGELVAGAGIKVPLRPARGEMVAVEAVGWDLQHTVSAGDGYLVPRGDEVLIGSTTAFVGFDARVTVEGVATLMARGAAMVPALRERVPRRTWAGLRPCPTIRRPIIASLPQMERVILATGHHRNGILLAPITAQLVREMITGTAASIPLAPFSYRRH